MTHRNSWLLDVEITFLRKVNWSLVRAGLPLVWKLKVHNLGSIPLEGFSLKVAIPRYFDTGDILLTKIPPDDYYEVNGDKLPWIRRDFEAAMLLNHPLDNYLQIEINHEIAKCPIQLLTPDEWYPGVGWTRGKFVLDSTVELAEAHFRLPLGGTQTPKYWENTWRISPPLLTATAALVFPEHPRVIEIKKHTMTLLSAIADNPNVSLDESISGTQEQQTQVVQAIFHALADLYPKAFHDIEKFSLEERSQRIRFPDEAVSGNGNERHGAMCVDYALLLCAVLESCSLNPLFILVGSRDLICHALVGTWLGEPKGDVLITDDKEIQGYLNNGEMLAIDVTEFSQGKNFKEACELGKKCLFLPYHFCYALDIQVARKEYDIAPLPRLIGEKSKEPKIVHTLLRAQNFQERSELTELHSFWRDQQGGVLGLIGIGGSGKTALVERFLCELPDSSIKNPEVAKQADLHSPDALFVWSFYESSNCEEFLTHLFNYICESCMSIDEVNTYPNRIIEEIERNFHSRILLMLDGLERVQEEHNFLGIFVDVEKLLKMLLQRAASGTKGLWIIATSRFPLVDLTGWKGTGYTQITIDQLSYESARSLLRVRGIRGTDNELKKLISKFGRHPLTLTHLGGLLSEFFGGAPNGAEQLPQPVEVSATAELDVQALRLSRILAFYEGCLSPEQLWVLKIISIFRTPIDSAVLLGIIEHVNPNQFQEESVPKFSSIQLNQILSRLTDLQLIYKHQNVRLLPRYSIHPAISQYFYRALHEDALLLHLGATEYLRHQVAPNEFRVPTRAAVRTRGAGLRTRGAVRNRGISKLPKDQYILDLLEESIYHALKAGKPEQAYRLYKENLGGYAHLGETLGDFMRGQRILAMFLSPADTAPNYSFKWLEEVRTDYKRYLDAMEPK